MRPNKKEAWAWRFDPVLGWVPRKRIEVPPQLTKEQRQAMTKSQRKVYNRERQMAAHWRKKQNSRQHLFNQQQTKWAPQQLDRFRSLKEWEKRNWWTKYRLYMASPEWQELRQRIIRKRGRKCESCGATQCVINLHHQTYVRLGRERERDLVILCESCHKKHHGKGYQVADKPPEPLSDADRIAKIQAVLDEPTIDERKGFRTCL